MTKRDWTNISLAAKCRILFGAAVLLILAATLYLPWIRMDSLSQAADLRAAQQMATLVWKTANLDTDDWKLADQVLSRDWPETAKRLKITAPKPELIPRSLEPLLRQTRAHGFLLESMRLFLKDPNLDYCHKFQEDDRTRTLRLAMAVRTSDTDPQPNTLRGIIHVRLPVEHEHHYWSAVVLVLSGLSGGVLAMLVFYLVTQRLILSPVRNLRAVAEQVTAGDTDVRAEIATGDEFEDLSDAFNDMLTRIKKSHDELRTINRSLDVKLGELAETNVALYESNKLKTEFIANVSHELRTPMGLIINFAELLRDALDDPPEDKTRVIRYCTNILKSARSLLDIINDLLDLAKIEAGKIELHIAQFSLPAICNALVDFVRPIAEKKEIQLLCPGPQELPQMNSDAGKIKQVLYNLLSNAIKFTPDGGTVKLDFGAGNDGRIWAAVTDTGPGIPEDMFATIFEKFRQIDSSLTREHSGTGLGLAITKELVHMLGGTIEVDSQVGTGSTFTLRLPINAPTDVQSKLLPLT